MQASLFDLENRYDQLSKLKDPLVELNHVIDWSLFAALLAETTKKPRKSPAGVSSSGSLEFHAVFGT